MTTSQPADWPLIELLSDLDLVNEATSTVSCVCQLGSSRCPIALDDDQVASAFAATRNLATEETIRRHSLRWLAEQWSCNWHRKEPRNIEIVTDAWENAIRLKAVHQNGHNRRASVDDHPLGDTRRPAGHRAAPEQMPPPPTPSSRKDSGDFIFTTDGRFQVYQDPDGHKPADRTPSESFHRQQAQSSERSHRNNSTRPFGTPVHAPATHTPAATLPQISEFIPVPRRPAYDPFTQMAGNPQSGRWTRPELHDNEDEDLCTPRFSGQVPKSHRVNPRDKDREAQRKRAMIQREIDRLENLIHRIRREEAAEEAERQRQRQRQQQEEDEDEDSPPAQEANDRARERPDSNTEQWQMRWEAYEEAWANVDKLKNGCTAEEFLAALSLPTKEAKDAIRHIGEDDFERDVERFFRNKPGVRHHRAWRQMLIKEASRWHEDKLRSRFPEAFDDAAVRELTTRIMQVVSGLFRSYK